MVEILGKKTNRWKKVAIGIFSSFFALVFLALAIFYGIFYNEVNALCTIKKEDDGIYSMTYKNDYFFDEFLKTGASSDEELSSFIIKKLLHGLPINFDLPDYGCSSFTATTEDGDHTFARNLDIDFAPIMIVKTYPKNGYSSISMVNLSALSFSEEYMPTSFMDKMLLLATPYIPFDGVNEKGVAICVNMVNGNAIQQNTGKVNITTTTLIRLVLDKAKNVDEAVELIKNYDLHDSTGGPYHFLIADKSGGSVVVEYYNNQIQVIKNEKNYQILTNHALNEFELEESYFSDTYQRYNTIDEKLTETNGVLSTQSSIDLLQQVKLSWGSIENNNLGGALYSVVYNLDDLQLDFIYKSGTQKIYHYKIDDDFNITNLFNYIGLIFVALLLIPNIIYAIKSKGKKQQCQNKIMNIFEQIGRYGAMLFMIFNIPYTFWGFYFAQAQIVYIVINSLLILGYYLSWIIYWQKDCLAKSLLLSIIPSCLFIISGILLANIPLIAFAIIFAIFHILISVRNCKGD